MKTKRNVFLLKGLFVAMLGLVSKDSYAQSYLLDFGPGSPSWCWQQQQQINAMAMQNMMMQQQVLQFYQNQANAVQQQIMFNPFQPVQGIMTNDGTYITPETVNNYHTERVSCEHCNGGFNQRTVYLGNGHTSTVKSRCSYCHGSGYVTKHVSNDR